jgi:hypothetical protein
MGYGFGRCSFLPSDTSDALPKRLNLDPPAGLALVAVVTQAAEPLLCNWSVRIQDGIGTAA